MSIPDPIAIEIESDLPRGDELLEQGRRVSADVEVGTTAFLERQGVASEREYRERARESGELVTAFNIGMKDWPSTVEALRAIESACLDRGVRPPDRYQLIPERRMGLPRELREGAPQETGPMLWDEGDWFDLGHVVSHIQPEVGDNMIGSPAGAENALEALKAGSTYVGCLSQFSWRWPYFDNDVAQVSSVVQACGVLAGKADHGVVLDSYLEDGYAGVFHDYASLVGWGMIERWVAGLMGCALSIAWGGLTADPVVKSVVTIALEKANPDRVPAAFVQGDTISYLEDLDRNPAIWSQDALYMFLVQAKYKTGACALSVPFTEVLRIPTWQEIVQVQVMARQLQERIPEMLDSIDWDRLDGLAETLFADGCEFFDRVTTGLTEIGVDVEDPFQVLLAFRRIGPEAIERAWGIGEPDPQLPSGRRPRHPTELIVRTLKERDRLANHASAVVSERAASPGVIVVGSSDVHEMAKTVLSETLRECGVEVVDAGINLDPEDLVGCAEGADAEAVVVTTHNGVAWSFGNLLAEESKKRIPDVSLFMGGMLNEDFEGSDTPVDVTDRLNEIGIQTPTRIEDLVEALVGQPANGESNDE